MVDPDVRDLGVLPTPLEDAEPVGEVVHHVARGDLDADLVQPRLGLVSLEEKVESFLPRVVTEVVRARALDGLRHETVTLEPLAHGAAPVHEANLTVATCRRRRRAEVRSG